MGADFARTLKRNLTTVFKDFGDEQQTSTQLGKLTLIKNGVGKDQISDFTCNLIRAFLAEYTEAFATTHINASRLQKFHLPKTSFNYKTETWNSKTYTLPCHDEDFVLLTPIDMLTKDEAWISHRGLLADFSGVLASVPNPNLRQQIENYFVKALPIEANRREREVGIERVLRQYPQLMDLYIARQESSSGEATTTSAEKVQAAQELFVDHLRHLVKLLDTTPFYATGHSSRAEALLRINFLKDVIEKQDGYRLFYIKGKPVSRESDLQIMFKLTWFASAYTADAEVNNGRGPADFIISYGSSDKTVIEFKLAKSSKIEKNLEDQAEIYSAAARATHAPMKVILFFSEEERAKINRILERLGMTHSNDIVLIDAGSKPSASRTH